MPGIREMQPDRQGACAIDNKLPAFRLDDEVFEELRDAK